MNRYFSVAVLAVALLFGLAGCEKKSDVIKIGIAGPITGAYAKFGEQLVRGATAAADAINEDGGINGKMIEIVQGDDQ